MLEERQDVDQEVWAKIERGAGEIIPAADLQAKLKAFASTGRPLRVKLGIDPSAPHLTLGHSVPLRKMRDFQDLGHIGVLVVGDFTRRIGDPSGKASTRALMSAEEIERNMESYTEQAFKILDPERTEIRYNSEWLGKLSFADLITLTGKYTVARMLERDDFAKRFAAERPISILEFLYPLAQAYDSVAVRADVELGGTDQKFNLLIGRDIQREYGQSPQVVLTVPLLIGTDGVRSMSQTVGNYVGLNEPAKEMYGKILAIPDELTESYFEQLTDVTIDAWKDLPARDAKRLLARTLVTRYHSHDEALSAEEEFDRVHIRHERPSEVETRELEREAVKEDGTVWIVDLLERSGLVASRGEAKRLIKQGGVRIQEQAITDVNAEIEFVPPMLVQVGKRKFVEMI